MMLAYLLARDGHHVTVLEKHKDFFRDFRGDTIHPSTLELMYELGILEAFLALPHQQISAFVLSMGGESLPIADLTHLPTHAKFVALMPQWDFLNFLAARAAKFPTFNLLLEHDVTSLIENDSHRVIGVHANTPSGPIEVRADLVVGCDGRHSTSRAAAHLTVHETGVPIDVLWFRVSRRENDPSNVLGNINYGMMLVLINRSDYFQCAFLIAKDSFATTVQPAGLPAFRASIARLVPFLSDRVDEITDWDQVKLLTVQINHLERWHPPVCSASETPPTPCLPSAESASTSPFRTPSPPPAFSRLSSPPASSPNSPSNESNTVASSLPASPNPSRSSPTAS